VKILVLNIHRVKEEAS